MSTQPFSLLFVCTGNICRSAAAEAMFRHRIREHGMEAQFRHDSAGMSSIHVGEAPDRRTQQSFKTHGVMMDDLRARNIRQTDYYDFDLILAMDRSHYTALKKNAPADSTAEVALYLPYAHDQSGEAEVPDPYYGDDKLFDEVTNMIDSATTALVRKLSRRRQVA